jgi:hypothetical protein
MARMGGAAEDGGEETLVMLIHRRRGGSYPNAKSFHFLVQGFSEQINNGTHWKTPEVSSILQSLLVYAKLGQAPPLHPLAAAASPPLIPPSPL